MDEPRKSGGRRRPALGGERRPRPPAAELFTAVVELASSGASAFKGTARRYSLCAADADDAYQRGLEILMTKAPTTSRSELRPWLHTVIKHEALALRRQRERLLTGGPDAPGETVAESVPSPDEGAAERERMRQTAEALGELKQGEIQCLLLKALGYSYDEISARTGFSWTKVNRSLTEGRKRFFARFDQIESGERCVRFAPLLSAACDGEVSSDDERRLKTHLRSCHACRAALRGYRAVPARLAQLLPPAVLVQTTGKGGWWSRLYESLVTGTGDRAAAIGGKLQHAGEMVAAQKTAAVVASTAALAGGAAVHERALDQPSADRHAAAAGEATHSPTSPVAAPVRERQPPAPRPVAGGTANDSVPTDSVSTAETSAVAEFSPEGTAAQGALAPAPSGSPSPPPEPPPAAAVPSALPSGAAARADASPSVSGGGARPAGAHEFGP